MTTLEPDFPVDYVAALTTLKSLIREAQGRAQRVVNTAMIELYWNIGQTILTRQVTEPWGNKVLDRLARDLRAEFPHMKGFSRTNVYHMRAFAAAWNGPEPIVQTPSGQLSWIHDVALLNKLDGQELRRWYASRAVSHGWSVAILEHQILTSLHSRTGSAPNNLEARLPGEGTCPIPASWGNTVRHRLNRGGDRRLNRAINTIVLTRMRTDKATREYVERKIAEGRSKREIMRTLKRYITRQIHRVLTTNPPLSVA